MYFLLVSVACPDIKRPYVDTELFFFETKEECYTRLKLCKIDFIIQNDIPEETLDVNSDEGLIDELFLQTSEYDTYYNEYYMANPPFNSVIGIVSSGMKYPI
jgi:hypothetical protein